MTQLAIIYHSNNPNCVLNMLHCIFKLNTGSLCKVEINQYIVINIIISLKRSSRCVRHRHRYIWCSFFTQQDICVVGEPEIQTVNADILSSINHRYIIMAHEIVCLHVVPASFQSTVELSLQETLRVDIQLVLNNKTIALLNLN